MEVVDGVDYQAAQFGTVCSYGDALGHCSGECDAVPEEGELVAAYCGVVVAADKDGDAVDDGTGDGRSETVDGDEAVGSGGYGGHSACELCGDYRVGQCGPCAVVGSPSEEGCGGSGIDDGVEGMSWSAQGANGEVESAETVASVLARKHDIEDFGSGLGRGQNAVAVGERGVLAEGESVVVMVCGVDGDGGIDGIVTSDGEECGLHCGVEAAGECAGGIGLEEAVGKVPLDYSVVEGGLDLEVQ